MRTLENPLLFFPCPLTVRAIYPQHRERKITEIYKKLTTDTYTDTGGGNGKNQEKLLPRRAAPPVDPSALCRWGD